MTATNARGHLSSETIDLLLLSALSSNEANEAKAHLDDCGLCKQRWMELNEDSQKFKQYVFARTLPAEPGHFIDPFFSELLVGLGEALARADMAPAVRAELKKLLAD
jgi:hypothetical protein